MSKPKITIIKAAASNQSGIQRLQNLSSILIPKVRGGVQSTIDHGSYDPLGTGFRFFTDYIGFSDSLRSVLGRPVRDESTISDSTIVHYVLGRNPADVQPLIEDFKLVFTAGRLIYDVTHITEQLKLLRTIPTITDTQSVYDDRTKLFIGKAFNDETVMLDLTGVFDGITYQTIMQRFDTATPMDYFLRKFDAQRKFEDQTIFSDEYSRIIDVKRTFDDGQAFTDTLRKDAGKAAADTISIADIRTVFSINKYLEDTAIMLDQTDLADHLTYDEFKQLYENVLVNELKAFTFAKPVSSFFNLSDSIQYLVTVNRLVFDTLGVTDKLLPFYIIKGNRDFIDVPERVAKDVKKTATPDTVTFTDSIVKGRFRDAADSFNPYDQKLVFKVLKALADTTTMVDMAALGDGLTFAYVMDKTERATALDYFLRSVNFYRLIQWEVFPEDASRLLAGKGQADQVSLSDFIKYVSGRGLFDTASIVERKYFLLLKPLSGDSASASDQPFKLFGRPVSGDSVSNTDFETLLIGKNNSETITELERIAFTALTRYNDTATVTESIIRSLLYYKTQADSIILGTTPGIRRAGDQLENVSFVDQFTAKQGNQVSRANGNVYWYSEDFANAAGWTPNGTFISSNVVTAPNGTLTADKLVENTSLLTHAILSSATHNVTTSSGITVSIYIKSAGQNRNLRLYASGLTGAQEIPVFNPDTGQVTVPATSSVLKNVYMYSVGNGWYRCVATINVNSPNLPNFTLLNTSVSTTSAYTGDGVSGLYIWGAQVNSMPVESHYIPTTSTAIYTTVNTGYDTDVVSVGTNHSGNRVAYDWLENIRFLGSKATADTQVMGFGTTSGDRVSGSQLERFSYLLLNREADTQPAVDAKYIWLNKTAKQGTTSLLTRGNLLAWSENFAVTTSWTRVSVFVTSNVIAAPNGTVTATKLSESDGTSNVGHYIYQNVPTVGTGQTLTASIYVKAGERSKFYWGISDAVNAAAASYDLSSVTVNSQTADNSSFYVGTKTSIQDVGGGWRRLSITATKTLSTGSMLLPYGGPMTDTYGWGSTTGSGVYIWGAQLEATNSLGPYFYTTTSGYNTLTRTGNDTDIVQIGTYINGPRVAYDPLENIALQANKQTTDSLSAPADTIKLTDLKVIKDSVTITDLVRKFFNGTEIFGGFLIVQPPPSDLASPLDYIARVFAAIRGPRDGFADIQTAGMDPYNRYAYPQDPYLLFGIGSVTRVLDMPGPNGTGIPVKMITPNSYNYLSNTTATASRIGKAPSAVASYWVYASSVSSTAIIDIGLSKSYFDGSNGGSSSSWSVLSNTWTRIYWGETFVDPSVVKSIKTWVRALTSNLSVYMADVQLEFDSTVPRAFQTLQRGFGGTSENISFLLQNTVQPEYNMDSSWVSLIDSTAVNGSYWWNTSLPDNAGNIYVVGRGTGNTSGFLAKFGPAGNIIWSEQLQTSVSNKALHDVAFTSGKTLITCGAMNSRPWLAAFNSSTGAIIWQQEVSQTTGSAFQWFITTAVTGNTIYTGGRIGVNNATSAIVASYNTAGTLNWKYTVSTTATIGYTQTNDIAIDTSGNMVAAVSWFNNVSQQYSSAVLIKINSSGTSITTLNLYNTRAITSSTLSIYGVLVDSSNNIYVSGGTNGGAYNNNYTDGFVAKIDTSNTLVWANAVSRNTATSFEDSWLMCTDSAGNIYTTTVDETLYTATTGWTVFARAWINKFNSSGTVIWSRLFQGAVLTAQTQASMAIWGISTDDQFIYLSGEAKYIDPNTNAPDAEYYPILAKLPADGSGIGEYREPTMPWFNSFTWSVPSGINDEYVTSITSLLAVQDFSTSIALVAEPSAVSSTAWVVAGVNFDLSSTLVRNDTNVAWIGRGITAESGRVSGSNLEKFSFWFNNRESDTISFADLLTLVQVQGRTLSDSVSETDVTQFLIGWGKRVIDYTTAGLVLYNYFTSPIDLYSAIDTSFSTTFVSYDRDTTTSSPIGLQPLKLVSPNTTGGAVQFTTQAVNWNLPQGLGSTIRYSVGYRILVSDTSVVRIGLGNTGNNNSLDYVISPGSWTSISMLNVNANLSQPSRSRINVISASSYPVTVYLDGGQLSRGSTLGELQTLQRGFGGTSENLSFQANKTPMLYEAYDLMDENTSRGGVLQYQNESISVNSYSLKELLVTPAGELISVSNYRPGGANNYAYLTVHDTSNTLVRSFKYSNVSIFGATLNSSNSIVFVGSYETASTANAVIAVINSSTGAVLATNTIAKAAWFYDVALKGSSVYVCGNTQGSNASGIVVKFDTSLQVQWSSQLTAAGTTSGNDVKINTISLDSTENVYVGGTIAISNNSYSSTGIVVKYDSTGNLLDISQINVTRSNGVVINKLRIDSSDSVYVVGFADGGIVDTTRTYNGTLFGKFTSSISRQWIMAWGFGGSNYAAPDTLVLDNSKNTILVGSFFNPSNDRSLVFESDSSGTIIWDSVIGPSLASPTMDANPCKGIAIHPIKNIVYYSMSFETYFYSPVNVGRWSVSSQLIPTIYVGPRKSIRNTQYKLRGFEFDELSPYYLQQISESTGARNYNISNSQYVTSVSITSTLLVSGLNAQTTSLPAVALSSSTASSYASKIFTPGDDFQYVTVGRQEGYRVGGGDGENVKFLIGKRIAWGSDVTTIDDSVIKALINGRTLADTLLIGTSSYGTRVSGLQSENISFVINKPIQNTSYGRVSSTNVNTWSWNGINGGSLTGSNGGYCTDLVVLPNGNMAVSARLNTDPGSSNLLLISTTGSLITSVTISGAGSGSQNKGLYTVTYNTSTGSILATGFHSTNAVIYSFNSSTASTKWAVIFDEPTNKQTLNRTIYSDNAGDIYTQVPIISTTGSNLTSILVKFNNAGTMLWSSVLVAGSGYIEATAIAPKPNGDMVMVGEWNILTAQKNTSVIVTYDSSNGVVKDVVGLYNNRGMSGYFTNIRDLHIDNSSNLYILVNGTYSMHNTSTYRAVVMKLNSSNVIQWAQAVGTPTGAWGVGEYGGRLTVDSSETIYYVLGGGSNLGGANTYTSLLVKMNSSDGTVIAVQGWGPNIATTSVLYAQNSISGGLVVDNQYVYMAGAIYDTEATTSNTAATLFSVNKLVKDTTFDRDYGYTTSYGAIGLTHYSSITAVTGYSSVSVISKYSVTSLVGVVQGITSAAITAITHSSSILTSLAVAINSTPGPLFSEYYEYSSSLGHTVVVGSANGERTPYDSSETVKFTVVKGNPEIVAVTENIARYLNGILITGGNINTSDTITVTELYSRVFNALRTYSDTQTVGLVPYNLFTYPLSLYSVVSSVTSSMSVGAASIVGQTPLVLSNFSNQTIKFTPRISVKGSTSYTFSVYINPTERDLSQIRFSIETYNSSDTFVGAFSPPFNYLTSNTWTSFTAIFTMAANVSSIVVGLQNNGTTGAAIIDGMQVTRSNTANPLQTLQRGFGGTSENVSVQANKNVPSVLGKPTGSWISNFDYFFGASGAYPKFVATTVDSAGNVYGTFVDSWFSHGGVVKFNSSGTVLWYNKSSDYGGARGTQWSTIQLTSSDGVFVAGYEADQATLSILNSSNGTVITSNTQTVAGGTKYTYWSGALFHTSSNIYAFGQAANSVNDFIITKFNSSLTYVWTITPTATTGTNLRINVRDVNITQYGELVAVGEWSPGGAGTTSVAIALKIDSSTAALASSYVLDQTNKLAGGGLSINSVKPDTAGNMFVAGRSYNLFTSIAIRSDGYIAKIDSSNAIVWATAIGNQTSSTLSARIDSICIDSSNNVYALCYGTETTATAVLYKFDSNGNYVWANTLKPYWTYSATRSPSNITTDGQYVYLGYEYDYYNATFGADTFRTAIMAKVRCDGTDYGLFEDTNGINTITYSPTSPYITTSVIGLFTYQTTSVVTVSSVTNEFTTKNMSVTTGTTISSYALTYSNYADVNTITIGSGATSEALRNSISKLENTKFLITNKASRYANIFTGNLIQYSEQFDQWTYDSSLVAVATNYAADPLGGYTSADLVSFNSPSSAFSSTDLTISLVKDYWITSNALQTGRNTFSIYMKAVTSAAKTINLVIQTYSGQSTLNFNISTGSCTLSGGGGNWSMSNSIIDVGNGWYKVSIYADSIYPGDAINGSLTIRISTGSLAATTSNPTQVILWGAQYELNNPSAATSANYVQTTGVARVLTWIPGSTGDLQTISDSFTKLLSISRTLTESVSSADTIAKLPIKITNDSFGAGVRYYSTSSTILSAAQILELFYNQPGYGTAWYDEATQSYRIYNAKDTYEYLKLLMLKRPTGDTVAVTESTTLFLNGSEITTSLAGDYQILTGAVDLQTATGSEDLML